ncbi:hypothetical protein Tsubulata_021244 [Turnera subulata]|uniref:Uncharacterized protein n=1 Tax=Turnera subulata TaxID=218843 RepID=A0A9Q0F3J7_9ROSI|nr:hypothetical protein Tsubulata_021244 [Turnera subulata]
MIATPLLQLHKLLELVILLLVKVMVQIHIFRRRKEQRNPLCGSSLQRKQSTGS